MSKPQGSLIDGKNREASWALILTVVAAYLYALIAGHGGVTPLESVVNFGLVVVYSVWCLLESRVCERVGGLAGLSLYYGVASLLVIGIQWLGHGLLWLAMMPLVVQAVFTLPRWVWLTLTALLLVFGFALPFRVMAGLDWNAVLQASVEFVPALIFVVVFSRVVAREHEARAEVERLAAELGEANNRLREYAAQAEELATTKERNRMAREIHDTLGHYLTVMNVQLEAAQAVMNTDRAKANDAVAKAQALAKDGLAEVRRSVAALRALPVENRSLPEAVAALAEECRAAGLVVECAVRGAPRRLPLPVEMALYRAAQEALTNVRKHARASRVDVALDYTEAAKARLTVKDNGVGADRPAESEGHFGLLGVRERAHLLGGEVQIVTTPGQGFRLNMEVPGEIAAGE